MEERGSGKGKTIVKTSLMTLLGLLLAAVIVAGILCLSAPRVMGDFTNRIGFTSFSALLAKSAYDRGGDVNDLGDVLERAYTAKNYKLVEEYSGKMLSHESYADFVDFKNKQLASRPEVSGALQPDYDNYVKGNYAYAVYRRGDAARAWKLATDFVTHKGAHYGGGNPVTRVVEAYAESTNGAFDATAADAYLRARFLATKALYEVTPEEFLTDLKNICMDGYILAKAAGDAEAKAYWETEYNSLKR